MPGEQLNTSGCRGLDVDRPDLRRTTGEMRRDGEVSRASLAQVRPAKHAGSPRPLRIGPKQVKAATEGHRFQTTSSAQEPHTAGLAMMACRHLEERIPCRRSVCWFVLVYVAFVCPCPCSSPSRPRSIVGARLARCPQPPPSSLDERKNYHMAALLENGGVHAAERDCRRQPSPPGSRKPFRGGRPSKQLRGARAAQWTDARSRAPDK